MKWMKWNDGGLGVRAVRPSLSRAHSTFGTDKRNGNEKLDAYESERSENESVCSSQSGAEPNYGLAIKRIAAVNFARIIY